MSEYYGLRYEVSYANFKNFVKLIRDEEKNRELSKQEAILNAIDRLRAQMNGLFGHVDGFHRDDKQVSLPIFDDSYIPSAEDPLAVFLEKVARSINALSITSFLISCRLDTALIFRAVDDDALDSEEHASNVHPLNPEPE
jgi:hypothetical protein